MNENIGSKFIPNGGVGEAILIFVVKPSVVVKTGGVVCPNEVRPGVVCPAVVCPGVVTGEDPV